MIRYFLLLLLGLLMYCSPKTNPTTSTVSNDCIQLATSGQLEKSSTCFGQKATLTEDEQRVYAGVLTSLRQYPKAITLIKDLVKKYPNQTLYLYQLGKVYATSGDYGSAKKYYEEYLATSPQNPEAIAKVREFLKNYDYISEAKSESEVISLLPDEINSPYPEYGPSLELDNQVIIFTRKLEGQEDLFISSKDENGEWTEAVGVSELNTTGNEGAHSISPDGKFILFTRCGDPEGYGSCDIFVSFLQDGKWTSPQNMGPVINSRYWDAQPNISIDNRTIIFSSNREDGYGGKDLYMTKWDNNQWSTPENLGPSINSKGNEESPFLHPDKKTLYFSSDSYPGYGKSDIYRSTLQPDQTWSEPVNLGKPYNDESDNVGFFVDWQGNTAYFHQRTIENGVEKSDIYSVTISEEAKPNSITYLRVKVQDVSGKSITAAEVDVVDLSKSETEEVFYTDKQGEILTSLELGKDYALYVQKDGYVFYNQRIELKERSAQDPQKFLVTLQPVNQSTEAPVTLHNVFFNTGESSLQSSSYEELEKLVSLLKENPNLRVKIQGHTDNVGSEADNLKLSNDRAKTVADYLISHGIGASRVSYEGYGETQPIASNDTEEGRRSNRRTEFVLLR